MDYYRQSQAVSHTGPAPQNYMYQPTSTPSNSGMYYQTMSGYGQQASPYAMQPSVSQGNSMPNQAGANGPSGNVRRQRTNEGVAPGGVMNPPLPRNQNDVPLRMLVDSKYVGAIIGQQGNKIKEITRDSKAKCIVDAQKGMRDAHGSTEKVIMIDGLPESTTKAVVKILEVIEVEREKERERELAAGDSGLGDLEKTAAASVEVELKLRAHNQLVGRLIGKQGATIKKIMSETETVIYVSNSCSLPDGGVSTAAMLPAMYHDMLLINERTITVKGSTIAAVSAAEQRISAKLRQAHEYDLSSRMAYGAAAAAAAAAGGGAMGMAPMGMAPMAGGAGYEQMARDARAQQHTTAFKQIKMYVPNNMVGAIIGSKGAHIRGIMRSTGATIRIEGNEKRDGEKKSNSGGGSEGGEASSPDTTDADVTPPSVASGEEQKTTPEAAAEVAGAGLPDCDGEEIEKKEEERLVTISGTDNQIYRAQYAIFAKISEQQQMYLEEVKLRSEVNVPSRLVGRIIGKGGQNVRELQRMSGVHVKIAEENNPENREKDEDGEMSESGLNGETTVRIQGAVTGTIQVQARIGNLVIEFHRNNALNENRPPNGAYHPTPAAAAAAAAPAAAAAAAPAE